MMIDQWKPRLPNRGGCILVGPWKWEVHRRFKIIRTVITLNIIEASLTGGAVFSLLARVHAQPAHAPAAVPAALLWPLSQGGQQVGATKYLHTNSLGYTCSALPRDTCRLYGCTSSLIWWSCCTSPCWHALIHTQILGVVKGFKHQMSRFYRFKWTVTPAW